MTSLQQKTIPSFRRLQFFGVLLLLRRTQSWTPEQICIKRCGLSPDKRFVSDSWLKGVVWSADIKNVIMEVQSAYQQISIVDTVSLGRALILDGALQCAEKDEAGYHEMMTHVPMLRHKAGKISDILIIGGGDGGIAREILKYKYFERLDMVEIDQVVVDTCQKFLPRVFPASIAQDDRFHLFYEDAATFVTSAESQSYDLIIIDASDPIGPGASLYTPTFYAEIKRLLRREGAVVAQCGSFFYLPCVFRTVYHGLSAHFPVVMPYSCFTAVYPGGSWNLAIATLRPSDRPEKPHSRRIRGFLADQQEQLSFYDSAVHRAAFDSIPPLARNELAKGPPSIQELQAEFVDIYGEAWWEDECSGRNNSE
mmetsp:Transcript_4539/g.6438  ORF Transcript_4539/g.6438 Transcript_4539/m.6438 type:complete len:367 (+) Transcript_4539:780-1880(+)